MKFESFHHHFQRGKISLLVPILIWIFSRGIFWEVDGSEVSAANAVGGCGNALNKKKGKMTKDGRDG